MILPWLMTSAYDAFYIFTSPKFNPGTPAVQDFIRADDDSGPLE